MLDRLREVARRWQDPDHPPRARAVEELLERWSVTEPAAAFAINRWMYELAETPLLEDLAQLVAPVAPLEAWGFATEAEVPLRGLTLALPVVAGRGTFLGEAADPVLVAFMEEAALPVRWMEREALLQMPRVILEVLEAAEVLPRGVHVFRPGYSVALLTGTEDMEALSGLAEDMLLFDGREPHAVRLLFAPEALTPDLLLEVLVQFRELFPPHPATEGRLAMARALLEALDLPRAYGPGFILSRGAPEIQTAGHYRWVPYRQQEEVLAWLQAHADEVAFVLGTPEVLEIPLPGEVRVLPFGELHRLALPEEPLFAFWWQML